MHLKILCLRLAVVGWLCGCSTAPVPRAPTLPASLVSAEHAHGLPVDRIHRFPIADPETTAAWQDRHCDPAGRSSARSDRPSWLEPMVVRITDEQVQWSHLPPMPVHPPGTEDSIILEPLLEAVFEARDRSRAFREACPGLVPDDSVGTVLVVVDQGVSHRTLRKVIGTVGNGGFASFAFLVDDPTPRSGPVDLPVGGLAPGSSNDPMTAELVAGMLSVEAHTDLWIRSEPDTPAVPLSRTAPPPRFLGEASPPTVLVVALDETPFATLIGAADRLAGAEVFCVELFGLGDERAERTSVRPSPTAAGTRAAVVVPDSGVLPVHHYVLPGFGVTVETRPNGARCTTLSPVHGFSLEHATLER